MTIDQIRALDSKGVFKSLTDRQLHCIYLRTKHWSYERISKELIISKKTVEHHVLTARLRITYMVGDPTDVYDFVFSVFFTGPGDDHAAA